MTESNKFDKIEEKIERVLDEEREKIVKRIKDSEYYKVRQLAFDTRTVRSLLKLFNKGVLTDLTWIINSGKESLILAGEGPEGEVAIKVYKIYTANFKRYIDYIDGDYRFKVSKDKSKIIFTWARKEYRNLRRMYASGVRVPKPIDVVGNVLVMEFIGRNGIPAPILKDIILDKPSRYARDILENIKKMYLKADLVHGDLSEYNIMIWNDLPWIIDVSQAVVSSHPNSFSLLVNDIGRITSFFKKKYHIDLPDPYKIAEELTNVK